MKTLFFTIIMTVVFVFPARAEKDLYERVTVLTPITPATQRIKNDSTTDFMEIRAGENPGEEFLKKQLPLEEQ